MCLVRRGSLALAATLLLSAGIAWAATKAERVTSTTWTDRYDEHFRKYAKRYFGRQVHWHWFKSQGVAESGLRPDATSQAGAIGIMQIMPETFAEIRSKSPYLSKATLEDPRWNIAAGIFYDRMLYKRWAEELEETPPQQDLYLAFASYNAGHSKIRQAVTKVRSRKGAVSGWEEVRPHTPPQTRHYVDRIRRLMGSQH